MRINKLFSRLFLLLCAVTFASCDKTESEELSLCDVENQIIYLTYGTKTGVTIVGGDQNYSFTCQSPIVKGEMTHRNFILFEPLAVGQTSCLIQDNSGNSYTLNIHIDYYTERMPVYKTDAEVTGKNLSEGQKAALKEQALATIPVKAGGGYLFVYTGRVNLNTSEPDRNTIEGIVSIYPEKFGENPINATFERTVFRDDKGWVENFRYKLKKGDNSWDYLVSAVSQPTIGSVLSEDLKTKFASDYAPAESVVTYQYVNQTDTSF